MQNQDGGTPADQSSSLRLKILDVRRIEPYKLKLTTQNLLENGQFAGRATSEPNKHIEVLVAGIWASLELKRDLIVHLEGPTYDRDSEQYYLDNTRGLLIVEPDNLVSCTAISSSLYCERKTWLDHVFAKRSPTNLAMLIGKLVHQLFLTAIRHKLNDISVLERQLDELLGNEHTMMEVYATAWDMNLVRDACLGHARTVATWVDRYILSAGGGHLSLPGGSQSETRGTRSMRLRATCDIEDMAMSAKYGLKGKVDVLGEVRIFDKSTRKFKDDTRVVLEVKTGFSRLCRNHTAQVELYQMLSEPPGQLVSQGRTSSQTTSQGNRGNLNNGYLTYLAKNGPSAFQVAPPSHNIKRDLLFKRNLLTMHFKDYFLGPATIDRAPASCLRCERLTECYLMAQLYDLDEDKFPHMATLARDATGHLDEKFVDFFAQHHERVTKLVHGHQGGSSLSIAPANCNEDRQFRGFPIRLLQRETCNTHTPNGLLTFRRSLRFIENFQPSENRRREIQSQPDMKRIKLDNNQEPAIKIKPFEFEGNLHLHCRVAIRVDKDALGAQNRENLAPHDRPIIGSLYELKNESLTIKLSHPEQRAHIKSDLIYRLDRLRPQRHKSTEVDLMRQVLVMLLHRGGRRVVRVRKLVSDPDYWPQQNTELSVSLLVECLGLAGEELRPACREPVVFEAASTNNYFVLNERRVPNKLRLDELVAAMVEVMISLDRRVLVVAQNIESLIALMAHLENVCKFIIVAEGDRAPSSGVRIPSKFLQQNVIRIPGELSNIVDKYKAFVRAHELAPVVLSTFRASRANPLFARQTFDYCVAYDCDKTELLTSLAPLFCCDRHILVDVDDGQCCAPYGDQDLATTLGDHLRKLRPALYDTEGGDKVHRSLGRATTT